MKIDFIKKCVPYADGFSIQYVEDKPKQLIYRSKNSECSLYFGSFPDSPLEPLLLTRTIEGINRADSEWTIWTNQYFKKIYANWKDGNNRKSQKFSIGDNIDEAKTAALEYVFEMEKKPPKY